ncbi:hypothetical protein HBI56_018050 [Parastagonospora nodorum]|uniref:Uncharacterized protein n=1 Tax=Phaeosphaeria nodorum (strain SN15 / ATCC MYA-4574 / FGSC 10173) TaxID=321614 RepID=A0A7U2F0Q4_PHANO|nr:hypothetical protein HBH56_081940 [Parastagonospora nodorum]QRC96624.1 hypothetical protein JI435_301000 [Parastagonospora nodorum SN15]KAH3929826.1 hypothetical protein HBH54_119900 [Parastagonospora nodorum]KAH3955350.1 hypothetical protein HBH53_004690 [Parastagonospora nodorum]KAH3977044.1 hypothetical protein HBH51_076850 [Parastagonospora nodorum]
MSLVRPTPVSNSPTTPVYITTIRYSPSLARHPDLGKLHIYTSIPKAAVCTMPFSNTEHVGSLLFNMHPTERLGSQPTRTKQAIGATVSIFSQSACLILTVLAHWEEPCPGSPCVLGGVWTMHAGLAEDSTRAQLRDLEAL